MEGHFEAYVQYVGDRRLAQAEQQNPELVEFNPPTIEEGNLDDEDTTNMDGEVGSPGDKEMKSLCMRVATMTKIQMPSA